MGNRYTPDTSSVKYAFVDGNHPRNEEEYLQLVAEFDHWLAAHNAEVRASAVAEEPEWEYGWKSHFPNGEEYEWSECKSRESAEETIRTLQEQEDRAEDQIGGRLLYTLWKRTKEKAGPWEAVTE